MRCDPHLHHRSLAPHAAQNSMIGILDVMGTGPTYPTHRPSVEVIPREFNSLIKLPKQVWDGQEVKDLCSALENNTTLNDFTATSHSLSVEDAEQFAGVLRSNKTLQSLSLGNSSFGNEALSALSGGLPGTPAPSPLKQGSEHFACRSTLHAVPVFSHDGSLQFREYWAAEARFAQQGCGRSRGASSAAGYCSRQRPGSSDSVREQSWR